MDCTVHGATKTQTWLSNFNDFPVAQTVRNLPAVQETQGLIPRSGKSSGKRNAVHSNILVWRNPWTEEPGRLQSMGLQRVGYDQVLSTQTYINKFLDGTCDILKNLQNSTSF